MSVNKDYNWLSCRTVHISGLSPEERHTGLLKTKLNLFLSKTNSGKVIDINFIPNYSELLVLEKKKQELSQLRSLLSRNPPTFECLFNLVYYKKEKIEEELNKVQKEISDKKDDFVLSSGHAFICCNSLKAAYKIMKEFQYGFIVRIKINFFSWLGDVKKFFKKNCCCKKNADSNNELINGQPSTVQFRKLTEDEYFGDTQIISYKDSEGTKKYMNLMVDQIIEPNDIIWANIGIERSSYVFRKILLNLITLVLLVFFTTPMSFLRTVKKIDTFKLLEFSWLLYIPNGYILRTYIVPFLIIGINLLIIVVIDILCRLEKHFTYSNYHDSVFVKSFFYMLLNYLIIPSSTISYQPLYEIIKSNSDSILELISGISSIYHNSYFFINLLIQNGTLSFVYYFLRLDELLFTALDSHIAFNLRIFINAENNSWIRSEADCFCYGYFKAQYMVFYIICLVFSLYNPLVLLAGIYHFSIRHFGDYTSLLTVHLNEHDSNGKGINNTVNYALTPVFIFHIFMFFEYISEDNYLDAYFVGIAFVLSILYYLIAYDSDYVLDIYSSNSFLDYKENLESEQMVSQNQINKWANNYKHPLELPFTTLENSKIFNAENIENDDVISRRKKYEIFNIDTSVKGRNEDKKCIEMDLIEDE